MDTKLALSEQTSMLCQNPEERWKSPICRSERDKNYVCRFCICVYVKIQKREEVEKYICHWTRQELCLPFAYVCLVLLV